jgi:formylglycine-generating enzyme required for sulfatase activity
MVGWLYERLEIQFGRENVFMDIGTIPLGLDFREYLRSAVGQCDVLLAVIGRNWFGRTAEGSRRLDDFRDFVRIEVEAALARRIPVIPILIDQAKMPAETDLPASLASLAYRNALVVADERDLQVQVDRLIHGIERLFLNDPSLPAPIEPPNVISNTIGMKLVLIPAGEFLMGSPDCDKDAEDDERPQHRVRITRPFYLGATQVTVGQFRQVVESTGFRTEAETDGKGGWGWNEAKRKFEQNTRYTWSNPGFAQTDEHPVVNVSWYDAIAYCNMLNEREGLKREDGYRLPTEAEWEYACRAGTTTRYHSGDDPETLVAVGNIADGTARAKYPDWTTIAARDGYVYTAPVGQFQPNAFGLFGMHGNVLQWCGDGYKADYYKGSPCADPPGALGASGRVIRGGSWSNSPRRARSANRVEGAPGIRSDNLGFRLARALARVQSGPG